MGEAKRRKRFDSNYGEKPYTIEFIDYERWITEFSPEDRQDLITHSPEDLENIKQEFEDKTFWAGYLKLENNNYSFIALISENKDIYDFIPLIEDDDNGKTVYVDLRIIKDIDNKKHLKIIERNKEKIYEEISRIILPQYIKNQDIVSIIDYI